VVPPCQVRWDHRGAPAVGGIDLPWMDPVGDSRMVGSRRPCEEVDIRDTVDIQDTAGNLPCVGAIHRDLPRIHGVEVDIPEAE